MNIVNNILSFFKLKKFNILCKNKDECIKMQKYLFKAGYKWEGCGKNTIETFFEFPIILKNYRIGDKFGSKFLIIDDFRYFSKDSKNKYVTTTGFIRKQKIKKMNLL